MIVTRDKANERRVDDSLVIFDYIGSSDSARLSLVRGILDGRHTLRRNRDCDQIYYILNGSGTITVDDEQTALSDGDCVLIPAASTHALEGNLEVLILNGPAYDPGQTEVLEP